MKNVISNLLLKLNHLIFWWYYKRVPEFYGQWRILKSISLLNQNSEHKDVIIKGKEEVISGSIKREREMIEKISNLELRMAGVSQETLDPFNDAFGTNLKGISKFEREN